MRQEADSVEESSRVKVFIQFCIVCPFSSHEQSKYVVDLLVCRGISTHVCEREACLFSIPSVRVFFREGIEEERDLPRTALRS
jgi:hypothetical protein